jgi:hypothetical protein
MEKSDESIENMTIVRRLSLPLFHKRDDPRSRGKASLFHNKLSVRIDLGFSRTLALYFFCQQKSNAYFGGKTCAINAELYLATAATSKPARHFFPHTLPLFIPSFSSTPP